ncbi:transgelin [Geosmithia morbida]|uniref:Transgelin n=1 Tax=Geosmithia morbida TaxID=1094350 RepID=A0A9P4YYQ1_9HYPO|nr:transgelin [Geosmithia morbida]KAF4124224.1 transgelin [Geosmithia morbida]
MASVTSLDKDLRKARRDKYTPAAANEARSWIENVLGERLPSSDLLEGLKDGLALCKLVNLAIAPQSVRFKKSAMPFVQMENISIFLRACQQPPLNLHQHDTFLTVDLYEQKDPAQVLQCLGAFSRAAHAAKPAQFPEAIGPKSTPTGGSTMSPQATGPSTPRNTRDRGASVASNTPSAYRGTGTGIGIGTGTKPLFPSRTGNSAGGGRQSPTKSPTDSNVSSWSRKEHESATSPAWNIAQYGYMGGASQGNLGIAFGARRQITTATPQVPSLADKERARREAEAEEERARREAEEKEEERRRLAELEEEERARLEEERRWEEETTRQREEERRRAEEERLRWEEEERQWQATEELRRREEAEADARLEQERSQSRNTGDARLRGKFSGQHKVENAGLSSQPSSTTDYGSRVKELERELELARQREAEYERERQERDGRPRKAAADPDAAARARSRARSRSRAAGEPTRQDSYVKGEREVLSTAWRNHHDEARVQEEAEDLRRRMEAAAIEERSPETSALSASSSAAALSPRPLPNPALASSPPTLPAAVQSHNTGGSGTSRPLPDPTQYRHRHANQVSSPPPQKPPKPSPATATSPPATAASRARWLSSSPQNSIRGGGGGSGGGGSTSTPSPPQKQAAPAKKSLLEREMEMERQRQKEWEEAQRETAAAARTGDGGAVGGRWDVSQWTGFTGGDSQNRGGQGIGAGRRQIVGPRPLPGSK